MPGIQLKTDATDIAREKAAYYLTLMYGTLYAAAHVKEVFHRDGNCTIILIDNQRIEVVDPFSATWLKYAARSPNGWAVNDDPAKLR